MVAICIGGGLVSVYQQAVGPLRFVGFIKVGWQGGGHVETRTESLFSPRCAAILPYYCSFQNLVLGSSGAALQDVINPKKTNKTWRTSGKNSIFMFTLSNFTRIPKAPGRSFFVIATARQIPRFHAICIFGFLLFIPDSG